MRTKRGYIAQITEIDKYIWFNNIINKESGMAVYELSKVEFENLVTKHSKNIIDLIEVGDYINGHKIVSELWGEDDNNLYFEIEGGFNKAQYIGEKDIKTILTHEQFEQNAYRLEE